MSFFYFLVLFVAAMAAYFYYLSAKRENEESGISLRKIIRRDAEKALLSTPAFFSNDAITRQVYRGIGVAVGSLTAVASALLIASGAALGADVDRSNEYIEVAFAFLEIILLLMFYGVVFFFVQIIFPKISRDEFASEPAYAEKRMSIQKFRLYAASSFAFLTLYAFPFMALNSIRDVFATLGN